jgi:biopolymer transport protein ExbB
MEMYEFLAKGGILMVPILFTSVLSLTVFFERLWALRRDRVIPQGLSRTVRSLITQGRLGEAETVCNQSEAMLARVVLAGLKHRTRPRAMVREAMEDAGGIEVANLERFTGVIATVATVAPLLGLLGTVTGMIQVFRDVATKPDPEISVLAAGIWEALITTAAGLFVAIPAYALHRYIMARIDRLAREVGEQSLEFLELIDDRVAAGGTDPAHTPSAAA